MRARHYRGESAMAKSLNSNLHRAAKKKNDEFYTQLADIEKEMKHYKSQFAGKVVYCNCDDPFESNFFKYFAANFKALKLKQLIATSYKPSPIANTQLRLFGNDETNKKPKGRPKVTANKFIINEVGDINNDGAFDLSDIAEQLKANKNNEWTPLEGDGDFRSAESIELLKHADIVVTNPPFSLFREYIAQLVEYKKQFLIIGNTNSMTYREIFRLFKEDKLRTGYTNFNVGMYFVVPDDWEKYHHIDDDGNKLARVSTSCWFTNLEVSKHTEDVTLYKKYSPEKYPKYENFDAINVNKYTEIPCDYSGLMGVPITFLDKHNPAQFEIVGLGISNSGIEIGVEPYKPEHKKYRKEIQKRGAVDGDLYMMKDGVVEVPYARVIIKNKRIEEQYED